MAAIGLPAYRGPLRAGARRALFFVQFLSPICPPIFFFSPRAREICILSLFRFCFTIAGVGREEGGTYRGDGRHWDESDVDDS